MPQTFYTEGEYYLIKSQRDQALEQVKVLEAQRPMWAKGYTSDSVAAQVMADALSEIYRALHVTNQTEAISKDLNDLIN